MNSTWERLDLFNTAFIKNFILVALGIFINYVNGTFVSIFLSNQVFYTDPRYILYINMVINDIIMLTLSVGLHVGSYINPFFNMPFCFIVLIIADITHKNTPLNLAGMAIERYIAICDPLRHAQVCTVRRTYVAIAVSWAVGAVPAFSDLAIALAIRPLHLFPAAVLCFPMIVYNSPYLVAKTTAMLVIYLTFVWLTLIYTYLRVMFAARAARGDPVSAQKARNTILLHAVQVTLCTFSYIAPWCDIIFLKLYPKQRTKILFSTFVISSIFPRLFSPLIYGIRDKKLFKYMKARFMCRSFVKVRPTRSTHWESSQ